MNPIFLDIIGMFIFIRLYYYVLLIQDRPCSVCLLSVCQYFGFEAHEVSPAIHFVSGSDDMLWEQSDIYCFMLLQRGRKGPANAEDTHANYEL